MVFRTATYSSLNSLFILLLAALLLSPVLSAQTATGSASAKPATAQQGASPSAAPGTAAPAGPAGAPQTAQKASENAPSSTRAARPAPAVTVEEQIAKLPPLTDTKIDVKAQSQAILDHLSDVLRFYRLATTKIQKAGASSDILYAEQSKAQATQIAQLAFQSARNEAALLERANASENAAVPGQGNNSSPAAQKLAAARARITDQIAALQVTDAANDAAIAHSNAKTRPALLQKQEQIDGEFKLLQATLDAQNRIASLTENQGTRAGLAGQIERLANSAPELTSGTGKSITAPPLENVGDTQHSGLVTQATVLFDVLSARRSIDQQIAETDRLRDQADNLRVPFVNVLRSLIHQGEALSQQSINNVTPNSTQDILATRKQFDELTSTFRVLSDAMLPLSQEIVILEQERGTLSSWRVATDAEYKSILRSLFIRAAFIACALLLLMMIGQIWSRTTVHYVSDLRRRRQLLLVRRIVIGFLGGLIVIFGFITQFSSLATFAGFLSAGIAVGLQTILLSVAAYFFIVGRYGVRVGDRITVAGVTGTVIEVGIARFYMMELVGSGTELHSTGRVAVFANSVLFQTGTPIYKQLPGTEYAWHELIAKLTPAADTDAVSKALVDVVDSVYQTYRKEIESQQHQIESWMGTALDTPRIDTSLRMNDDGLQVAVLFPVRISEAAKTDEAIATKLVQAMKSDEALKTGLASTPAIKAAIKI